MTAGLLKTFQLTLLTAALLALSGITAIAQRSDSSATQSETVTDENFVIVSLLVSDPGDALFSRLGHAALRMQCPQHGLDFVFTYESEDGSRKPVSFLAGRMRMGLCAISPDEYISEHLERKRGLAEYTLNLPLESKRELWRALDNHLAEGMELKFDYMSRGCAHSTLMMLKEGLGNTKIQYGAWPDHFRGASRREVTYHHIHEDKWTTLLLHFIVNGEIDRLGCSNEDKTIIPADLPFILSNATVDGVPVINTDPVQIVPSGEPMKAGWLSPVKAAIVLLILTTVCAILGIRVMDHILLVIQTILGTAAVFLLFSSLVCTEWSWLIVPFNPLPAIFWKWRRRWALPYAVILLVWSAVMLFWPHMLTDRAYIVITLAITISNIVFSFRNKRIRL